MSRKLISVAVGALLFALCLSAEAQQPKKVFRIGFLLAPSLSATAGPVDAFRQGLRELGYVEGQNIVTAYRYAEGNFDRLPGLAAELIHSKVDVIVAAGGSPAFRAAKNASSTIPIVITSSTDPVASGLVTSLARPGGNITGLSIGGVELYGKRLELLKQTVPKVSRIAFFWYRGNPDESAALNEMHASARALGLEIQSLEVRSPNDFETSFAAAAKGGARAFAVHTSRFLPRIDTASWSWQQRAGCPECIPGGNTWRTVV